MKLLFLLVIVSFLLMSTNDASAAKMDCESILNEWAQLNYHPTGFNPDIMHGVKIDENTSKLFLGAEQTKKDPDTLRLTLKLLDQNNFVMKHISFRITFLTYDGNALLDETFHDHAGFLELEFKQKQSTAEFQVIAQKSSMGYVETDRLIVINSPVLDGIYRLNVYVVGACDDKINLFYGNDLQQSFPWSFSVNDGKSNYAALLSGDGKILPPLQQYSAGVAMHQVKCKEDLSLLKKTDNGFPICVHVKTGLKLLERKFAASPVTISAEPEPISAYQNKRPLPNGKFDNNLENVIPWLMMIELKKHGMENWKNDPSARAHTDEGWSNPSKICSRIFLENGTEHYVSTTFYPEPVLKIIGIFIDDTLPKDCQKSFWVPHDVDPKTGIFLYGYDKDEN